MSLSLQQILDAKDLKIIRVNCPEWGGVVCMLPFSGDDRDWYDQIYTAKRFPGEDEGEADWRGMRSAAVARALCNEAGEKFNPSEADVAALGTKSGAALDRCFVALRDASGIGFKSDEDAEKNWSDDPSDEPG